MASTYTTIQGDAWDLIAWKLWGDEKYMKWLIEANWRNIETLVFPAGVVLTVPDLPKEATDDKPFWRNDDSEEQDDYYEYSEGDADTEDEDEDEETDEDLNDNESEDEDEEDPEDDEEDPEE